MASKASALERVDAMIDSWLGGQGNIDLHALVGGHSRDVFDALVLRASHPHPLVGANLALAAGAMVEVGMPAKPLGLAVIEPVMRTAEHARAGIQLATARGWDLDDLATTLPAIAAEEPRAAIALEALDTWYRPAVASWTRDVETLRAAQGHVGLRAALGAIGSVGAGAHWMGLVLEATMETPFVALFPELGEAWSFISTGCSDLGQLSVLMTEVLAEPLRRVGVSPASEGVIAVMRGDGPQQGVGSYACDLHVYPWQAVDPSNGMPVDKRYTWLAPGGSGDHSLPPDFPPSRVTPLRGVRVLALVGPRAATGVRFTRVLAATRIFSGLRASLDAVRRLDEAEARAHVEAVRLALSS